VSKFPGQLPEVKKGKVVAQVWKERGGVLGGNAKRIGEVPGTKAPLLRLFSRGGNKRGVLEKKGAETAQSVERKKRVKEGQRPIKENIYRKHLPGVPFSREKYHETLSEERGRCPMTGTLRERERKQCGPGGGQPKKIPYLQLPYWVNNIEKKK